MEQVDIAGALDRRRKRFPEVDLAQLTFFVERGILAQGPNHTFRARWHRSPSSWTVNRVEEDFDFSRVLTAQLVQIGSQIEV